MQDAHERERRLPSRRRLRIPSNVNNVKQLLVSEDSETVGAVDRTGEGRLYGLGRHRVNRIRRLPPFSANRRRSA